MNDRLEILLSVVPIVVSLLVICALAWAFTPREEGAAPGVLFIANTMKVISDLFGRLANWQAKRTGTHITQVEHRLWSVSEWFNPLSHDWAAHARGQISMNDFDRMEQSGLGGWHVEDAPDIGTYDNAIAYNDWLPEDFDCSVEPVGGFYEEPDNKERK
jgi:hypothetical protein